MTKKFKLKDLEQEADQNARDETYKKISLDALKEETRVYVPVEEEDPAVHPESPKTQKRDPQKSISNKKVIVREEVVNEIIEIDRDGLKSFFLRALTFAVIFFAVDVVLHFLKILDQVDVLNPASFDSVYFSGNETWNVVTGVAFLLVVNFLTPSDKILMNTKGLRCRKAEVTNFIVISSQILLQWNEIASAEYKYRFFEPYIFFYSLDCEEIGHIDVTFKNNDDFFKAVGKLAGVDHPVYKLRSQLV